MIVQTTEVVKAHIPSAPIVGVISTKEIEQGASRYGENIAGTVGKQFQTGSVWAYADYSASAHLQFSTIASGGFKKSKVSGGYIEPTINAQIEAVGGVVGGALLKAEGNIVDQAFIFLGYPIAIPIEINGKMWGVEYIEAVVIPYQSARRIDRGNEFGNFICPAIPILVP